MRIQFLFFLILMSACTDIIQISDDSKRDEILVVEGQITDKLGPYTINLSTTTTVGGLGSNTLGRGATVIIEEDTGDEEILREITPGVYQTKIDGIQGKIGNSYKVKIALANGEQYESIFERIPDPVEITSLNAEFIDERFKFNGIPRRTVGHQISARFMKEIDVEKFYRFEIEGILEAEIAFGDCDPSPAIPFPICYVERNPLKSSIKTFNDSNANEGPYSVNDIVLIPIEQKRRYLAKVEVLSFSASAYNFWSSVEEQLSKKGDIFDSPIPPVIGNIKNINTDFFAQGYFTAASTSRDEICIDRSNVQVTISIPIIPCNGSCVEYWAPASFIEPDFGLCQ